MNDRVTYKGSLVPCMEPIHDLMDDLIACKIPHRMTEIDGAPAVLVGDRLRLYWHDESGVFAGWLRGWDFVRERVTDEWTPAEFLPHTGESRWFVVHPVIGVEAIAAGWEEP